MTERRAATAFILITVLLDVLALGIVIPVLPKLIEGFLGGDTAQAAQMLGLFMTLWALMQFVGSPIQGALSDHFGRRPVVLASNFGLGIDYLVMALAPTVWWLLIGRVLSGLTAASFSTATAYIADVTEPAKRAAAFGKIGAAFGVGFVLGPAFGGWLGEHDPRLPFWVASGLSLANFCYGWFVLPESLPPERRERFAWRRANPIGSLKLLRSHPELFGLASSFFLFQVAHWVLPSSFVLYTGYRYGWSSFTIGTTLALVGVCNIAVQGFLVRPVVKRLGERRALVLGLVCGMFGMGWMGLAPEGWLFLISLPLLAMAGFFAPSAQALMTQRVPVNEQGQLQGANASFTGITGLFAPFLFTQVLALGIAFDDGGSASGLPFLLAATCVLMALTIAVIVTRRHPAPLGAHP
jgi:DHA1 family tetracycline resistance protein-like MFS transporter